MEMTGEKKVNIKISMSKNYNTVAIELLDEPVGTMGQATLEQDIKERCAFLRRLIAEEFDHMTVKKA